MDMFGILQNTWRIGKKISMVNAWIVAVAGESWAVSTRWLNDGGNHTCHTAFDICG